MLNKYGLNLLVLLGICFLTFSPISAKPSADLGVLPPAAQSALKKALDNQLVESITPLQGGFSTSKLYKVNTATQSYVLRLLDLQLPFTDRDREIKCMEIASQEDIAPKVYYANPKDGIIMMEFIQNKPLSKEERSPEILLPRVEKLAIGHRRKQRE
jgi:hypothetical protein